MKFSAAFTSALLAASVSAAPTKSSKKALKHHGHPLKRFSSLSNSTYDSDSTNWAGASISPPDGQAFNSVSGTFVVPQPSVPDGASPGAYAGSAWVGIDGTDGTPALLQSGSTWTVDNSNGDPQYSYVVWTEWLPAGAVNVDNFPVNSGDTITVTVTATDSSHGVIVIADETSGQTTTTSLTPPTPTATIVGKSAEWIVEDFSESGGQAPFANYGTVAITNCAAGTAQQQLDATGATLIDMVDSNGNVISQASQASNTEIDLTYQ